MQVIQKSKIQKTIGDKIRELRTKTLKLKQIELADILKIERAYLSQIESNKKKPGRDLLIRFCNEFKLSLDWITSDQNENDSSSLNLSEDERLLLKAFRDMPTEEAEIHLKLMIQRVKNHKNQKK